MKEELDKQLVSDFPLLFSDRYGDMTKTCMCWGFACGDGWYGIIREAAEKLEPLIAQYRKDYPEVEYYPRASQVKEKFGTLRFYLTHGTDGMFKITDEAKAKSYEVCEECGKKGQLREGGWFVTLCDKCNKKRRDYNA